MQNLLSLLETLIQKPSVTPSDAGCQDVMIDYLHSSGFQCQRYDAPPASNFFARIGEGRPFLVFAGHTDVVDAGPVHLWQSDPFKLTHTNTQYYGRGVADMKGALACMMDAATLFLQKNKQYFKGSLGFLITSAEEGSHYQLGTPFVMQALHHQGILPDYCLIGEPSSQHRLADMIKIGRRGSLNAQIQIQGKQGHVAYPHLALNPVSQAAPAIHELSTMIWDMGNAWFPPTSLQITQLKTDLDSFNVIPGELSIKLNCRFSTEQTAAHIQKTVEGVFEKHRINARFEWFLSGEPFLTEKGRLLDASIAAAKAITGLSPELSTTGGTSDGRFIAPYGIEVVELGLCNKTIHQINECIDDHSLIKLRDIYLHICEDILLSGLH